MLTPLLLAVSLAAVDPKTDKEPLKDCFIVESFKRDLSAAGFTVATTDREIAVSYLSTLVNLGVPAPSIDIADIEGLVIVTTPEAPDMALVGIISNDGQLCHAINVPRNIHHAILRGA